MSGKSQPGQSDSLSEHGTAWFECGLQLYRSVRFSVRKFENILSYFYLLTIEAALKLLI